MQASIADSLPPLPESVANIALKIAAKPLLDKAETLTPTEFTSEQWPGYTQQGCDFRYKYRFVRSALKFTCVDNRVTINLTGSYQVAGSRSACLLGKQIAPWINGSCGFDGEPLRRVNITLASTLRFLPNYTLRSQSAVEAISPVDKCAVSFLNTDITDLVMNTVRNSMRVFTTSLDRDAARLNFSPLIRDVKTGLAKGIALGNYGHLSIRPTTMNAGRISYAADTIYLVAGVAGYLDLSSRAVKPVTNFILPPLASTALTNGFSLYANAVYEYPFISHLLTRSTRHRIFAIRNENIAIDSIEVNGLGEGMIELKAIFSGSKKGVLYLTGTPRLDTNKQLITVPDLRFSLRSNSFVLNAGKSFFNKKILRTLRKQAIIDLNNLYIQNKAQLDKALTHQFSKHISSSGSTEHLMLKGMVVKKDQVMLQLFLTGNGTLSVLNLDLQD